MNLIPDKRSAIKIYGRLKPVSNHSAPYEIDFDAETKDNFLQLTVKSHSDDYVNNRPEQYNFKFSKIFNQDCTQDDVFKDVAKPVIDSAFDGYNGTIFAYGQTGSGKTYTMTGKNEGLLNRGIIPRTLSYIFTKFEEDIDGKIQGAFISYLEIYNECGYDLLNTSISPSRLEDMAKVGLLEDGHSQLHLRNLSVHQITTEEEALQLLYLGDHNRTIAETPQNEASTRSHCIFTIHINTREINSPIVRRSKIHLVDLAGSERVASNTTTNGQLFSETRHINLALHYLEQVIVALGDSNRCHIPYRNSMMTSVLRDSLGGNCMTSMIATMSMDMRNLMESLSTCRFAQRVALVTNNAIPNEESDPALVIAQQKMEIRRLKEALASCNLKPIRDDPDPITADEYSDCSTIVEKFINDPDPNAMVTISPDMRLVQCCFKQLKQKICGEQRPSLKGSSTLATGCGTAGVDKSSSQFTTLYRPSHQASFIGENKDELMKTIALRDQEIKVLGDLLKKEKIKRSTMTMGSESSLGLARRIDSCSTPGNSSQNSVNNEGKKIIEKCGDKKERPQTPCPPKQSQNSMKSIPENKCEQEQMQSHEPNLKQNGTQPQNQTDQSQAQSPTSRPAKLKTLILSSRAFRAALDERMTQEQRDAFKTFSQSYNKFSVIDQQGNFIETKRNEVKSLRDSIKLNKINLDSLKLIVGKSDGNENENEEDSNFKDLIEALNSQERTISMQTARLKESETQLDDAQTLLKNLYDQLLGDFEKFWNESSAENVKKPLSGQLQPIAKSFSKLDEVETKEATTSSFDITKPPQNLIQIKPKIQLEASVFKPKHTVHNNSSTAIKNTNSEYTNIQSLKVFRHQCNNLVGIEEDLNSCTTVPSTAATSKAIGIDSQSQWRGIHRPPKTPPATPAISVASTDCIQLRDRPNKLKEIDEDDEDEDEDPLQIPLTGEEKEPRTTTTTETPIVGPDLLGSNNEDTNYEDSTEGPDNYAEYHDYNLDEDPSLPPPPLEESSEKLPFHEILEVKKEKAKKKFLNLIVDMPYSILEKKKNKAKKKYLKSAGYPSVHHGPNEGLSNFSTFQNEVLKRLESLEGSKNQAKEEYMSHNIPSDSKETPPNSLDELSNFSQLNQNPETTSTPIDQDPDVTEEPEISETEKPFDETISTPTDQDPDVTEEPEEISETEEPFDENKKKAYLKNLDNQRNKAKDDYFKSIPQTEESRPVSKFSNRPAKDPAKKPATRKPSQDSKRPQEIKKKMDEIRKIKEKLAKVKAEYYKKFGDKDNIKGKSLNPSSEDKKDKKRGKGRGFKGSGLPPGDESTTEPTTQSPPTSKNKKKTGKGRGMEGNVEGLPPQDKAGETPAEDPAVEAEVKTKDEEKHSEGAASPNEKNEGEKKTSPPEDEAGQVQPGEKKVETAPDTKVEEKTSDSAAPVVKPSDAAPVDAEKPAEEKAAKEEKEEENSQGKTKVETPAITTIPGETLGGNKNLEHNPEEEKAKVEAVSEKTDTDTSTSSNFENNTTTANTTDGGEKTDISPDFLKIINNIGSTGKAKAHKKKPSADYEDIKESIEEDTSSKPYFKVHTTSKKVHKKPAESEEGDDGGKKPKSRKNPHLDPTNIKNETLSVSYILTKTSLDGDNNRTDTGAGVDKMGLVGEILRQTLMESARKNSTKSKSKSKS